MKIAIYIEDGVTQIVLTPEGRFEVGALAQLQENRGTLQVFTGSFYECKGGWIRESASADSTIIRINAPTPAPQEQPQ